MLMLSVLRTPWQKPWPLPPATQPGRASGHLQQDGRRCAVGPALRRLPGPAQHPALILGKNSHTSPSLSVQFSHSHVRLCDPMSCSAPGLPVHRLCYILTIVAFTQTREIRNPDVLTIQAPTHKTMSKEGSKSPRIRQTHPRSSLTRGCRVRGSTSPPGSQGPAPALLPHTQPGEPCGRRRCARTLLWPAQLTAVRLLKPQALCLHWTAPHLASLTKRTGLRPPPGVSGASSLPALPAWTDGKTPSTEGSGRGQAAPSVFCTRPPGVGGARCSVPTCGSAKRPLGPRLRVLGCI